MKIDKVSDNIRFGWKNLPYEVATKKTFKIKLDKLIHDLESLALGNKSKKADSTLDTKKYKKILFCKGGGGGGGGKVHSSSINKQSKALNTLASLAMMQNIEKMNKARADRIIKEIQLSL